MLFDSSYFEPIVVGVTAAVVAVDLLVAVDVIVAVGLLVADFAGLVVGVVENSWCGVQNSGAFFSNSNHKGVIQPQALVDSDLWLLNASNSEAFAVYKVDYTDPAVVVVVAADVAADVVEIVVSIVVACCNYYYCCYCLETEQICLFGLVVFQTPPFAAPLNFDDTDANQH